MFLCFSLARRVKHAAVVPIPLKPHSRENLVDHFVMVTALAVDEWVRYDLFYYSSTPLLSAAAKGSGAREPHTFVESVSDVLFVRLHDHGVAGVDDDDVKEVLQDIHLMF